MNEYILLGLQIGLTYSIILIIIFISHALRWKKEEKLR